MPKTRRQGPGAGLKRTVLLFRALLRGEALDARRAAELLDIKEPAALRQLRALSTIDGVSIDTSSGRQVWAYRPAPSTWGLPAAIAACFGSSLAPLFEGSGYQQGLHEVRQRFIQGTPRRQAFRNIERKFWFHSQGGDRGITEGGDVLDELIEALLAEKRVRLRYGNYRGEEKVVAVEPLSIVLYQHQLYLLAREPGAGLHPFRLARIREAEALGRFVYPPQRDFNPGAVFADSFGVWVREEPVVDIELELHAEWATYAQSHRWHSTQRVEDAGEKVRLTLRCRVCPELEQWVLSFGEQAEVVRPQSLRDAIASRAAALARRYAGPLDNPARART